MSTPPIPVSTVPGANVISNPIVDWDNEFDAPGASLAGLLVGSAVNVQPAELSHYRYEEGRLNVEQISDQIFL